ncbi:MAG: hypothetical protein M1812_006134 [Candelaria pacifica]|nr:MAG: hypothetical protein M1812_006134 [Candelaria pacifica]
MEFPFFILSLCLTFISYVVSCPAPVIELEKRASCNADNLLRALKASTRTADSYPFCSSYISIPATTTTLVYTSTSTFTDQGFTVVTIQPAGYCNLQHSFTGETPINYPTRSPTPVTVPGGDCNYPPFQGKRDLPIQTPAPNRLEARSTALPSYVATYPPASISSACSCLSVPVAATQTISDYFYTQVTSGTCTSYDKLPYTSYPAFCATENQANAATVTSLPNVVTVSRSAGAAINVPSKLDCCALCGNVFNCIWWKFDFKIPNQPFSGGTCTYAFHTDIKSDPGFGDLAICPNGALNFPGDRYGSGAGDPMLKTGYNPGACGGAFGVYQSSQDQGFPTCFYDGSCRNPSECGPAFDY